MNLSKIHYEIEQHSYFGFSFQVFQIKIIYLLF